MNIATRTTYHHGNLGPALIAAARELLDADGPGAVSLREAARRVGVSATATYRHFTDKDHLFAAVAAEGYLEFAEKLRTRQRERRRVFAAWASHISSSPSPIPACSG